MADYLGEATCPLCGTPGQQLTLSKKQLAVMTCMAPGCKCQIFARGAGSDEKLRDRIGVAAPAPAPIEDPAATPAPTPAPTRKPMAWGMLRGA